MEADHQGKTDEAIQHYEKALSYSPNYYPAHNNLGSIYLGRQNFDEAQSQFEAALKANQNDVQAYFNLANVFCSPSATIGAKEIEEGSSAGQIPPSANSCRDHCIRAPRHPELAEKSLQGALQLDPKMSEVICSW